MIDTDTIIINDVIDALSDWVMLYPFRENNMLTPYPLFSSHIVTLTHDVKLITNDNYYECIDIALDTIRAHAQSIHSVFLMISKPYRLDFLDYAHTLFDCDTYSTLLGQIYKTTEFPHQMGVLKLNAMFRRANKALLCDHGEYKTLRALPHIFKVYRGLQHKDSVVRGLSWTRNYKQAKWFAERWLSKGEVYCAKIDKESVYAYYYTEDEVVVNPCKLKNVRLCDEDTL